MTSEENLQNIIENLEWNLTDEDILQLAVECMYCLSKKENLKEKEMKKINDFIYWMILWNTGTTETTKEEYKKYIEKWGKINDK